MLRTYLTSILPRTVEHNFLGEQKSTTQQKRAMKSECPRFTRNYTDESRQCHAPITDGCSALVARKTLLKERHFRGRMAEVVQQAAAPRCPPTTSLATSGNGCGDHPRVDARPAALRWVRCVARSLVPVVACSAGGDEWPNAPVL